MSGPPSNAGRDASAIGRPNRCANPRALATPSAVKASSTLFTSFMREPFRPAPSQMVRCPMALKTGRPAAAPHPVRRRRPTACRSPPAPCCPRPARRRTAPRGAVRHKAASSMVPSRPIVLIWSRRPGERLDQALVGGDRSDRRRVGDHGDDHVGRGRRVGHRRRHLDVAPLEHHGRGGVPVPDHQREAGFVRRPGDGGPHGAEAEDRQFGLSVMVSSSATGGRMTTGQGGPSSAGGTVVSSRRLEPELGRLGSNPARGADQARSSS